MEKKGHYFVTLLEGIETNNASVQRKYVLNLGSQISTRK